jgi:hypothetical protein
VVFKKRFGHQKLYYLYDGELIIEIGKESYWKAVAGLAASRIMEHLECDLDLCAVSKNDKGFVAACIHETPEISIFHPFGELKRSFTVGEDSDFDCLGIVSFAWDEDNVWCAAACENAVYLYSPEGIHLDTAGVPWDETELSYPEHVSYRNGALFICDMGHNRVARCYSEDDYRVTTYRRFEESAWEWHYNECLDCEIVRLESGIYAVRDELSVI